MFSQIYFDLFCHYIFCMQVQDILCTFSCPLVSQEVATVDGSVSFDTVLQFIQASANTRSRLACAPLRLALKPGIFCVCFCINHCM